MHGTFNSPFHVHINRRQRVPVPCFPPNIPASFFAYRRILRHLKPDLSHGLDQRAACVALKQAGACAGCDWVASVQGEW